MRSGDKTNGIFFLGVVSVLALALVARLAVIFISPGFRFPDEHMYFNIGRELSESNRYAFPAGEGGYAIRQAPGLPFTLAVLGKTGLLSPVSAQVLNALAAVAAAGLYCLCAWRITRRPMAALALAMLAGFHPALLFTSVTNYPQAFQELWFAGLVWLWGKAADRNTAAYGLGEGAVIGVGAMYVPTQIFAVPATLAFHLKSGWGSVVRRTVFVGMGLVIAITPWTIRNAVVEKEFIPFSTSGGEQFFLGFNPQAGMNTGIQIQVPESIRKELAGCTSGKGVERVYALHGKAWIRENPGSAVRLWMAKFVNFFRLDNGKMVTVSESRTGREWLARATTVFVFALAISGAWRLRRTAPEWPLAAGVLMFVLAAGHACFIARYRYRLPFEPFLMLIGVIGWFGVAGRSAGSPPATPSGTGTHVAG